MALVPRPSMPVTEITPESSTTNISTNEPVVRAYPPRRPNIFSKRAPKRNVGWSPEVLDTIPHHATEDDNYGLTAEEFEEFTAAGQAKMGRKTEGFKRMFNQHSWKILPLNDLDEAFALED